MDLEGAYAEELSAIQVAAETLQIMSVFHAHAKARCKDEWARRFIHGLNIEWLRENAEYDCEASLVEGFNRWMKGKNVLAMYANNPAKERSVLHRRYHVHDFPLSSWERRDNKASHGIALRYTRRWVPLLNQRCCPEAHADFKGHPNYHNSERERAKQRWGVHCSLYDCAELYFAYIESPPNQFHM